MPYYGEAAEEDKSLELYLREIARTPLLTREQEQELGGLVLIASLGDLAGDADEGLEVGDIGHAGGP